MQMARRARFPPRAIRRVANGRSQPVRSQQSSTTTPRLSIYSAVADEIGEAMGEDAEVAWMCWGSVLEVRMPASDVPELVVTIQGAATAD